MLHLAKVRNKLSQWLIYMMVFSWWNLQSRTKCCDSYKTKLQFLWMMLEISCINRCPKQNERGLNHQSVFTSPEQISVHKKATPPLLLVPHSMCGSVASLSIISKRSINSAANLIADHQWNLFRNDISVYDSARGVVWSSAIQGVVWSLAIHFTNYDICLNDYMCFYYCRRKIYR
jgi:hypothetical protein